MIPGKNAKPNKIRLAALIGGGGRLKAIAEGTAGAGSRAGLELVVSFKNYSAGLEWAREQGFPGQYHRWSDWKAAGKTRLEFDLALAKILEESRVGLVVLAGWGLMLSPEFLARFPGRVINIHPALLTETALEKITLSSGITLPVFRGHRALEEAWEAGVPFTGCTVHYVTPAMDVGPVLLSREIPRLPGDTLETLSGRVHQAEDELLPRAIELACEKLQSGPA